jgi:urease accessory protein
MEFALVDGVAQLCVRRDGEQTAVARSYNSDPYRWLFPLERDGDLMQAVPVVTSGGIVAGDTLAMDVEATAGSSLNVVGQAAEKIYRSNGPVSETSVILNAREKSWLEWMPQGTIFFDGARARRRLEIDRQPTAKVLAGELLYFGRHAMGENYQSGLIDETWTLRVDGRMTWTDRLRITARDDLLKCFKFDGATAFATLVYAGDLTADDLAWTRALWAGRNDGLRIAATALPDLLICRLFGRRPDEIRALFSEVWAAWRHRFGGHAPRMPRLWDI